jgi:hypothetical protein
MAAGARVGRAAGVIGLIGLTFFAWRLWFTGEEGVIRRRLEALRDEINAGVADGLDNAVRAAAIGGFFTEDVLVDLGQGTAAINGRDTVMGMAARLQPRTAAFKLELQDIGVTMRPGDTIADVTLTGTFIRRSITTGEESIDAREFALVMTRADGTWRISRLTAVDTLK